MTFTVECNIFLHCISLLHALYVQHHQFDGVVLEIWSQLGGHHKRLDILYHFLLCTILYVRCTSIDPLVLPSFAIALYSVLCRMYLY